MKTAIYPGTFDPITYGHIDVIKKSLNVFDRLIVATTDNINKNYHFSIDDRLSIINNSLFKDLNYSKNKIKVNCLSPGVIQESRLFKQYASYVTKETIKKVKESHPLGLGTFNDINHAVNFLISENSEWFTGQNFILDGGYSSQWSSRI